MRQTFKAFVRLTYKICRTFQDFVRLTCQACTTTTPTTTTTTTTSGPLLKRSYVDEAVLCRTGPLPKRRSSETLLCRSSPLPRRTCATAVLCQSGPRPKGSSATCGHLCRSAACVWTVECVECVGASARAYALSVALTHFSLRRCCNQNCLTKYAKIRPPRQET